MRLSINLQDEEVGFLDAYARSRGIRSRSGVVSAASQVLRRQEELSHNYKAAFAEWGDNDDSSAWDRTTSDGLKD